MTRLKLIQTLSVAVATTALGTGALGYLSHLEKKAGPAYLVASVFSHREVSPGVWESLDAIDGDPLTTGDQVRLYFRSDETTWVDVSTVGPTGEASALHRAVVDGELVWPAPGEAPLRMGAESTTLVVRARPADRDAVPELAELNAAAHGEAHILKDDVEARDPGGATSGFTGVAVEGSGGWIVWRQTLTVDPVTARAQVPGRSALVARPGGPQ